MGVWSIRRSVAAFLAVLVLLTGVFTTSSMASATPQNIASAKNAAQAPDRTPDTATRGWKTKLAAEAIRRGGPFVSKLVSKVSPKAGKIFKRNLDRIADWIEKAGNVQEAALAGFLMNLGIPSADAWLMARYIVLVFGL